MASLPRAVLASQNVLPDFEYRSPEQDVRLDFIHRRTEDADIYFVRNMKPDASSAQVTFRTADRAPELWHSDTGVIEQQSSYRAGADGRTTLPLSLEPYGSIFVVFRHPVKEHLPESTAKRTLEQQPIEGSWTIHFPTGWGAPAEAVFPHLQSWTESTDPGVRYFSGTARYTKTIDIAARLLTPGEQLYLDLGEVKELAQVTLNGHDLGILWKKPFEVEIGSAAKPGENKLEIAIVNLWPNRLIGDQQLPPEKRFTHTNILKFRKDSPLLPSGLIGPVRLITISQVHLK